MSEYYGSECPLITKDVVLAAVDYIKLRDFLGGHLSPEGKRLNEAVKKYIDYKTPNAVSER